MLIPLLHTRRAACAQLRTDSPSLFPSLPPSAIQSLTLSLSLSTHTYTHTRALSLFVGESKERERESVCDSRSLSAALSTLGARTQSDSMGL